MQYNKNSVFSRFTISSLAFMVLSIFMVSCSSDEEDPMTPSNPTIDNMLDAEVWEGANLTFSKEDGADPANEANQDRITDNVWITRGNTGGEIYNARSESASSKDTSPAGTMWALGRASNANTLNFGSFRQAVGAPKDAVGKDLVLLLVEDNVLIDIKFTSWSQGRTDGGGFSYERSTSN